MPLPVSYLTQESFVLSCNAETYDLCLKELYRNAELTPTERKQLQHCYRRIRNREYAKQRRRCHQKEYNTLQAELERLRCENALLRQELSQTFEIK